MHALVADVIGGASPRQVVEQFARTDGPARDFADDHLEEPFEAPRSGWGSVIVSPSIESPGGWRVTYLGTSGRPTGHTEHLNFEDAVVVAARKGAKLDKAIFESALVEVTAATLRNREKRKVQRVDAWVEVHKGKSFSVPADFNQTLMIHPGPQGGWRGTKFHPDMTPRGHAEFRTQGQAVFWGMRVSDVLDKAVMSPNPESPRAVRGLTFN